MQKYFFHGIRSNIQKLEEIFESGAVLSKRQIHGDKCISWGHGYNGYDYISLCKKLDNRFYSGNTKNAFYRYIYNEICIIFTNTIGAIKTITFDSENLYPEEKEKYINPIDGKRYSDLIDEYQVKDKVLLFDCIGIGYPYKLYLDDAERFKSFSPSTYEARHENIAEDLNLIQGIIQRYNGNINIYDSSEEIFARNIKKAILKLKK